MLCLNRYLILCLNRCGATLLLFFSACLTAAPTTIGSPPTQFFREPGADILPSPYSSNLYEHQSRESFLKAVQNRLRQEPTPRASMMDSQMMNQARKTILLFALQSQRLLIGAGSDSYRQVNHYANLIVAHFKQKIHKQLSGTSWTTAHLQGLTSLAFSDETLNLLELMEDFLPDVHFSRIRTELNEGLVSLQQIVQAMIPNSHMNGLSTMALISLNATLRDVLNGRHPSRQSIHNLARIRRDIDRVLISSEVTTPYPHINIDPETMIDHGTPATPGTTFNAGTGPGHCRRKKTTPT